MRRPWRAIALWLVFVVVADATAFATGIKSLQNGAVGESARGYELIDEHQAYGPTRECGYVHSDALRAATGVPGRRPGRQRADGARPWRHPDRTASTLHDVLVVGQWTHPYDFEALRASVLALGKAHPDVTIEETGDISASEARDRVVSNDLRRAELLSVPVTLFVLLFAFGAVVAALVPVLLALTAVAAAFGLLGPISQVFRSMTRRRPSCC